MLIEEENPTSVYFCILILSLFQLLFSCFMFISSHSFSKYAATACGVPFSPVKHWPPVDKNTTRVTATSYSSFSIGNLLNSVGFSSATTVNVSLCKAKSNSLLHAGDNIYCLEKKQITRVARAAFLKYCCRQSDSALPANAKKYQNNTHTIMHVYIYCV